MRRNSNLVILLITAILTASRANGDAPSTQPATQPAVDCSTPMAFMTSYDRLAGEDPPAYLAMYWLDDQDDTQRVARVESKFDAQVGMLQKIVQQKWGNDAADEVLHALGLKSMRDIQGATVKENGRHATVTFGDGTPGPELLKTKTGWRLDLPAFCKSLGMPVDDYLKQIRQLSKILPDVADGIADGKLRDSSAVVSDIARRISADEH